MRECKNFPEKPLTNCLPRKLRVRSLHLHRYKHENKDSNIHKSQYQKSKTLF